MENCPYCNEFMEIASDTPDCTHISIDPQDEWCCLNCNAHFDLDLQEVPIDEDINKKPSIPTNPTDTPAQNPNKEESSTESKGEQGESKNDSSESDSSTEDKDNEQDSSQESNTESSKGDSSTEDKDNEQDSSQESNTGQKDNSDSKEDSKENPSQPQTPQPPQNLTLTNKEQITLAKQIYMSLKSYDSYTKIHTDIIPIIESLQDYLAQDFDFIA